MVKGGDGATIAVGICHGDVITALFHFCGGRWSKMKEEPLDAFLHLKAAEQETWHKGSKSMSIKSSHSLHKVSNVPLNIPNTLATAPKCNAGNGKDSDVKGIGKVQTAA